MKMNLNNFIIDRPIQLAMFSKLTGELYWRVNQIEEPHLKCTSTSEEVVDALGSPIMIFDRAKKAEFTASNAILDLGLAAAQFGSAKEFASDTNKIVTPKFQTFTITEAQTSIVLAEKPVGVTGAEIKHIYGVNKNTSISENYVLGATASATEFTVDAETKTITLPTGLPAGTIILVKYDYESSSAVKIENDATEFPKAGSAILQVLGHDVCDQETKYVANIVMPNTKLKSDVDLTFNSKGKHPMTLEAMQDYCDEKKELFSIVIAQE